MPTIILETYINAVVEICFDLIRDEHIQAQPPPAIFGEFGPGQLVTFKSKQFGIEQSLTVRVVEFDRPRLFVDEMIAGSFKSFKHTHEFNETETGTLMKDTLMWTSPFGILGKVVDKLLLERHLTRLVQARNDRLKALAEEN